MQKNKGLEMPPLLKTIKGFEIPSEIEEINEFLKEFTETKAGIDTNGKSEGLVLRNKDRSKITKMRIARYEKAVSGEIKIKGVTK